MFDLATTRRAGGLRRLVGAGKSAAGAQLSGRAPPTVFTRRVRSLPDSTAVAQRPFSTATTLPGRHASSLQVRGIVFDMGDVLYDATLWRRWLYQLLVRMGLHGNYRTLYRVWDMEFLQDVHCGHREFVDAFHIFLLSLGLSRGQVDEVEAASQARKRELELGVRPLPGVRDTIQRLAAHGIPLAVLNNSEQTGDELQAHLARLGLGGCFSPVISSIDVRYTKPSPICYRAALARLNLPREAIAFVGHDGAELAGARAVGMRTVAFNHEAGARADHYLTRFEELLQIVESSTADTLTTAA